jgi:soluble lytic murein transglycosylase-like protein
LAAIGATPAAADVMELGADGQIVVRAADQPMVAEAIAATPEMIGEIEISPEALTQVTGSAAPQAYMAAVDYLADLNGISPALLEALVWQESRWRPGARSPVGAIGLAQLMPGTARDLQVNPHDPHANLAGGARYLRQQLDRFGGDVELALAAYNAGPGRVQRARGVPAIRETQAYVRAVVDRLSNMSNVQGTRP